MTTVIGVDGCPAGWIAVRWAAAEGVTHHLCRTFAEVLALDGAIIAVDMPIGFSDDGRRTCESLVRTRLGDRQSSVFAVPTRAAVMCLDYREACTANARLTDPPKKVSKQIFHIFPKMREIDALITPALQERVCEVHPELSFWAMNGESPLPLPKKVKSRPHEPGLALRRALLVNAGFPYDRLPPSVYKSSQVGADDLLDACACAWSARRILEGRSLRFPEEPPRDSKGLRMEINA
jgi:predicted RNase H-like nuclease